MDGGKERHRNGGSERWRAERRGDTKGRNYG
jgi:hypothetical protein